MGKSFFVFFLFFVFLCQKRWVKVKKSYFIPTKVEILLSLGVNYPFVWPHLFFFFFLFAHSNQR